MRFVNIPNLESLLAGRHVSRPEGLSDDDLRQLGLRFDVSTIWLADDAQPIDRSRLLDGLSARAVEAWPEFTVLNECESTNATLMLRSSDGVSIGEQAVTTEFQWGGRGRRGRTWLSPIARNLAVSVSWEFPGTLADMSGLSLAVGVACADALHTLGLSQVSLKWPNDLIVLPEHESNSMAGAAGTYAKLGGILVELLNVQRTPNKPASSVAVVGVGLNIAGAQLLRNHVGQPLADVAELDPALDRTTVLIALVNALADYLEQFAQTGFAPMVSVWNELHAFTGRQVVVGDPENLQNGQKGVVLGISESGALRLATPEGELLVGAGEVSLRPQTLGQGAVDL